MKVNQVDRDLIFIADDQEWTDEDVYILENEYNVYYDKGVIAVRKIERDGMNPIIQVSVEDDGFIQFREGHTLEIDSYWVSDLINVLKRVSPESFNN